MLFLFAVQRDLVWIAPELYKIVLNYLHEMFWPIYPAMLVKI